MKNISDDLWWKLVDATSHVVIHRGSGFKLELSKYELSSYDQSPGYVRFYDVDGDYLGDMSLDQVDYVELTWEVMTHGPYDAPIRVAYYTLKVFLK